MLANDVKVTPDLPRNRLEEDVEELPLLLPKWQIAALAKEARSQGMTAGQFLRHMLGKALLASHQGFHLA